MNTYAIELWGHTETAIGPTAGKAKYSHFLNRELGDFMTFGEFVKQAECRLVRKFRVADLFGDIEHFNSMKQARGIDFVYQGMKVTVDGRSGIIIGANYSQNLDVCFDSEWWPSNVHPHWRVKYFDQAGNVVAEYGA